MEFMKVFILAVFIFVQCNVTDHHPTHQRNHNQISTKHQIIMMNKSHVPTAFPKYQTQSYSLDVFMNWSAGHFKMFWTQQISQKGMYWIVLDGGR